MAKCELPKRDLHELKSSFSTKCAAATAAKSLQSCLTPCKPMDCSLPGSSVHGIFQARVLEWGASSFSRGSPHAEIKPGSPALQALPSEPPGKPTKEKEKRKGEKERYTRLNAEFQRIARRDKKAFLSD